ncbi:hypothetical protein BGX28_004988 [Mortierella sp. GBA30]|nr:hypothetical protein BGX28_004988 [Mortierella sp. GBA30]
MLSGSRILSHAVRGAKASQTIIPLRCTCPQPRSFDPILSWGRTFLTTRPSFSAEKPLTSTIQRDPSSTTLSQQPYYTRTRRKTKHRKWRRHDLLYPQEDTFPVANETRRLLKHLTELHPGAYRQVFMDKDGSQRFERFKTLHVAIQNQDPEAMWRAYQDIRKDREGHELLSPDVLRLLVIHFKDATSSSSSLSPSATSSPLKKSKYVWDHRAREQIWAPRIVTVLDDKRSLKKEFSRWDCSDLMSALNRCGRYEESLQELDAFIDSNLRIDPILLNHAVRAWGGLERLDKAMETIREMKTRYNVKPSEYTLGYIIQQYLLRGQRSDAISFWNELSKEKGSLEDLATVNGILRACVRVQDSDFAQIVYDAMPRLGIESDIESLNLMLSLAVAEIQYPEDRTKFLQTIQDRIQRSDRPVFDRRILDSILVNFSKKGDAEGAILIHQLMQQQGFSLEVKEYNAILHCFARLQQMDKAIHWFWQMRRSGIRPDGGSFMLLIQSYTLQRSPRATEALFRQMLRDGLQVDLAVCNYLLLAYEQARMNRRCLQLYRTMLQDRSIGLDQFSFSCMFNAVFHQDKALLEGGEGRGGSGSSMDDNEFLLKIGEPIGRPLPHSDQRSVTLDNAGSRMVKTKDIDDDDDDDGSAFSSAAMQDKVHSPLDRMKYQFDDAVSMTTSLDPRSLFRDMIIVGIRPTKSLYSNILRAFLAHNDYAGAAVALRVLIDYYMLKPTPKMSAIVVSWVCQELERRGQGLNQKEDPIAKADLSKLINMMGRTRGLIDIVEKVAKVEQHRSDEKNVLLFPEEEATLAISLPTKTKITTKILDTRSSSGESKMDSTQAQEGRVVRIRNGALLEQDEGPIAKAEQDMGGDLVDLFSRSVIAGSTWSMMEDRPTQMDLKDFERWYRAYSNRTTHAQAIKDKQSTSLSSSSANPNL